MIVGAADASANVDGSNEHMAIIVGEEIVINSILKKLGFDFIHMSRIKGMKTKNYILDNLDFYKYDIFALCVKTERTIMINKFLDGKKNKQSSRRIRNIFDYALLQHISPAMANYLTPRKCTITDVPFQCDTDCIETITIKGIKCCPPSKAHVLADIVAWANTHERLLEGVDDMDLVGRITKSMTKQLGK